MARKHKKLVEMLKKLEAIYTVFDWRGRIHLYQPGQGGEFVATLDADGMYLIFNEKFFDNAEKLIEEIKAYNDTLPWPMSCYNEMYRKAHRLNVAVAHYLENIGFEEERDHNYYGVREMYVMKTSTGNVLTRIGVDDLMKDDCVDLTVFLSSNASCLLTIKTLDEVVPKINGIIQSTFASEVFEEIMVLEKMNDVAPIFDGKYTSMDMSTFKLEEMSMKEYAIKRLESTLRILKGE